MCVCLTDDFSLICVFVCHWLCLWMDFVCRLPAQSSFVMCAVPFAWFSRHKCINVPYVYPYEFKANSIFDVRECQNIKAKSLTGKTSENFYILKSIYGNDLKFDTNFNASNEIVFLYFWIQQTHSTITWFIPASNVNSL